MAAQVDKLKYFVYQPTNQVFTSQNIDSHFVVRWTLDQLYVNQMVNEVAGFKTNKKGGVTVSIRKQGGWAASWLKAKTLAGWPTTEPADAKQGDAA